MLCLLFRWCPFHPRWHRLQVDEIFINFLKEKDLYNEIWQAFAVFMDVRSVGVQVHIFLPFALHLPCS